MYIISSLLAVITGSSSLVIGSVNSCWLLFAAYVHYPFDYTMHREVINLRIIEIICKY